MLDSQLATNRKYKTKEARRGGGNHQTHHVLVMKQWVTHTPLASCLTRCILQDTPHLTFKFDYNYLLNVYVLLYSNIPNNKSSFLDASVASCDVLIDSTTHAWFFA